ncbi:MAG: hypothetical protein NPIRA05_22430 [Nitrospirales bacterium]|nr:MAG: hypothetical protein NPIRA05_22430 [Nitrospirales bacterium]
METGPFSLGFGTYCVLAKNERVRSQGSDDNADDASLDALGKMDSEEEES